MPTALLQRLRNIVWAIRVWVAERYWLARYYLSKLFGRRERPVGLLGAVALPFAAAAWAQIAVAAAVAGFVGYHAGHFVGDRHGYQRHEVEVAEATAKLNAELQQMEADLAIAKAKMDGARDAEAKSVMSSLADIPLSTRQECASKCSMPKRAREGLEAIQ